MSCEILPDSMHAFSFVLILNSQRATQSTFKLEKFEIVQHLHGLKKFIIGFQDLSDARILRTKFDQ